MGTREGEALEPGPNEPDLAPLGVVEATESGGWTVVNLDSLKVVEPGYLWPSRERAVAWARSELERMRSEEVEYRRRQDEPVREGLARSWAAHQRGEHPAH